MRKNQINYQIKVLDLPESRVGAKLVDLYRKDVTPKEAFEKNEMLLNLRKIYYRKKVAGRPTKKDRRDIEDYQEIQKKRYDNKRTLLLNHLQVSQKIEELHIKFTKEIVHEKEVILAGIVGNGFVFAEKLVGSLNRNIRP